MVMKNIPIGRFKSFGSVIFNECNAVHDCPPTHLQVVLFRGREQITMVGARLYPAYRETGYGI
jgi:hypothetical protein